VIVLRIGKRVVHPAAELTLADRPGHP
jgi:hypothetical protein